MTNGVEETCASIVLVLFMLMVLGSYLYSLPVLVCARDWQAFAYGTDSKGARGPALLYTARPALTFILRTLVCARDWQAIGYGLVTSARYLPMSPFPHFQGAWLQVT